MGRQIGGWVMGRQISGSMGRSVPIDSSSRMRSSLFKISAVARFRVLAGPGVAHYSLQNLRNLEYGAILNARDARTKFREARDDFIDAVVNVLEGIEHDAGAVLLNPLGVVALLRHGPGIVDDDDRQALLYGFADAPGARLADEEIAEVHEVADLWCKADHEPGRPRGHGHQPLCKGRIVAADQYELRVLEPSRNALHGFRPVSAEQNDAGGPIRVQLQLEALGAPIAARFLVEVRPHDHAGRGVNLARPIAQRACLRHRFAGTAYEMLRLARLDPKVRR